MTNKELVGDFIFQDKNKQALNDNDFDLLYNNWENDPKTKLYSSVCLTNILLQADIDILSNIRDIPVCAFEGIQSDKIKKLIFPSNVRTLSVSAFSGSNVRYVNLNNVFYLHSNSFAFCNDLERVDLGIDLKAIMDDAFLGCGKLKTINYAGTKKDWLEVYLSKDAFEGTANDIILYCSDGELHKNNDNLFVES